MVSLAKGRWYNPPSVTTMAWALNAFDPVWIKRILADTFLKG
jgi:hypothetical protein